MPSIRILRSKAWILKFFLLAFSWIYTQKKCWSRTWLFFKFFFHLFCVCAKFWRIFLIVTDFELFMMMPLLNHWSWTSRRMRIKISCMCKFFSSLSTFQMQACHFFFQQKKFFEPFETDERDYQCQYENIFCCAICVYVMHKNSF